MDKQYPFASRENVHFPAGRPCASVRCSLLVVGGLGPFTVRAPRAEPTAPGEEAGMGEGRAAESEPRGPGPSGFWLLTRANHNGVSQRPQKSAYPKHPQGPDHPPQSQV